MLPLPFALEQGGIPLVSTYEGRAHNSYAHNIGLTIGYKF